MLIEEIEIVSGRNGIRSPPAWPLHSLPPPIVRHRMRRHSGKDRAVQLEIRADNGVNRNRQRRDRQTVHDFVAAHFLKSDRVDYARHVRVVVARLLRTPSITWERTPHPARRSAFSPHLLTAVVQPTPFR